MMHGVRLALVQKILLNDGNEKTLRRSILILIRLTTSNRNAFRVLIILICLGGDKWEVRFTELSCCSPDKAIWDVFLI